MNNHLTDISAEESSSIKMKVFGIPVKEVQLNVVNNDYSDKKLIVGGHSIGVALYTKGALVVGVSDVMSSSGNIVSPAEIAGIIEIIAIFKFH